MTVTDFTLMAVLVIVITFGLVRAGGAKHPIERGICLFGAVAFTVLTPPNLLFASSWSDY